jgi:hypothetical protein
MSVVVEYDIGLLEEILEGRRRDEMWCLFYLFFSTLCLMRCEPVN